MATATKIPTDREMLDMYQTPIEQTPAMRRVLDALSTAVKEERQLKARDERARHAREHGSHEELLTALQDAPAGDDLRRAEAETAIASKALADTRAAVKASHEERFRVGALSELARSASFVVGVLRAGHVDMAFVT